MAVISIIRKVPGRLLHCKQCGSEISAEWYANFHKNNTQSKEVCMDCIAKLLHELMVRNAGRI